MKPNICPEPDWVASEREQFTDHRDTDKDGFMNLEEVTVEKSIL